MEPQHPDPALSQSAQSACMLVMLPKKKNASKAMTQRMAWRGTDKCSILECVVAEAVGAERSAAECRRDADCMAEVYQNAKAC